MSSFFRFAGDDRGAINPDFVALTAGAILLGLVVIYAIYNVGVTAMVNTTNGTLDTLVADIDPGTPNTLTQ